MVDKSFFKVWMNCSSGSNTKGELLSLWILLWFSSSLDLDRIHIFGDSKIIVDWEVGLHCIRVLHLDPWLRWVQELLATFHELTISHIFREQNVMTDALSRLSLQEDAGFIYFERWLGDALVVARDRMVAF